MGRAGATLFAAEGAKTVVADIDQESGARVCESICREGGEAVAIPVNVRSVQSVTALVDRTVARYGRIDVFGVAPCYLCG